MFKTKSDTYTAGCGKYKITGPIFGISAAGYEDETILFKGIHQHLFARAFIINDNQNPMPSIIVVCEICQMFGIVTQMVRKEMAKDPELRIYATDDKQLDQSLLICATHTHSGVGSCSECYIYNITGFGVHHTKLNILVNGIVESIRLAHRSLQAVDLYVSQTNITTKISRNRSLPAYLNNTKEERDLYDNKEVDTILTVLNICKKNSRNSIGCINWFPIHGTSSPVGDRMVSGDNKGYAAWYTELMLSSADIDYVAAYAQSNAGDSSPNIRDNPHDKYTYTGPFDNTDLNIKYAGKIQADAVIKRIEVHQNNTFVTGPISSTKWYVDFPEVVIATTNQKLAEPVYGQDFAAGTKDGPTIFARKDIIEQGQLKVAPVIRFVSSIIFPATIGQFKEHAPKIPLVTATTIPRKIPFQTISIGHTLLIMSIPFETTTMSGRRIVKSVQDAINSQYDFLTLSTYGNNYVAYMATKEEYQLQYYEGASTLFGPLQLEATQQEMVRLARYHSNKNKSISLPKWISDYYVVVPSIISSPYPLLDTTNYNLHSLTHMGAIINDVKKTYKISDTVIFTLITPYPNPLLSEPNKWSKVYFVIEKQNQITGLWSEYIDDNHFDTKFIFGEKSKTNKLWVSRCEWNITDDYDLINNIEGTYRFNIDNRYTSGSFIVEGQKIIHLDDENDENDENDEDDEDEKINDEDEKINDDQLGGSTKVKKLSGYNLYIKETMPEIMANTSIASKKRFSEIAKKWKALSEESKKIFTIKALNLQDQ